MIGWLKKAVAWVRRESPERDSEYTERYRRTPTTGPCTSTRAEENQPGIVSHLEQVISFIRHDHPLHEIRNKFLQQKELVTFVNFRDAEGYSLLQHAVISARLDVVRYLVGCGADLNGPICGRPLHLAARLGLPAMVQLLLELGADPEVLSCVCYPDEHYGTSNIYNSVLQTWTCQCVCDIYIHSMAPKHKFEFPLYYAIKSDNIDCVQLFLQGNMLRLNYPRPLLHVSCSLGSPLCTKMFVEMNPKEINTQDTDGFTPIMYGVKWGKAFTQYLVLSGAQVMVKSVKEETLLHLALKNKLSLSHAADTIEYLLSCGLGMAVNTVDQKGLSALSLLMRLVHFPSRCCAQDQYSSYVGCSKRCTKQQSEDENIIKTALLLLENGANPNIPDKLGNTSLHVLHGVQESELYSVSDHQRLSIMCQLQKILLDHGANANLKNHVDTYIIENFLEWSLDMAFKVCGGPKYSEPIDAGVSLVIETLENLHKSRCNFSNPVCLHHIAFHQLDKLSEIEQMGHNQESMVQKATQVLSNLQRVTQCLLRCGALQNVCSLPQCDFHTLYYKLMAYSSIVAAQSFKKFVLLFVESGADMMVSYKDIPMSVFRYRPSQTFWPVSPLMHVMNLMASVNRLYSFDELAEIFRIIFNTLDYGKAQKCVRLFLKYDLIHKSGDSADSARAFVQTYSSVPFSLQHWCRASVYKAMDRKLYLRHQLPMPGPLIEYLISLHE